MLAYHTHSFIYSNGFMEDWYSGEVHVKPHDHDSHDDA